MAVTGARISHFQGRGGKTLESTQHFLLALRLLQNDLGTNSKSKSQYSSIVVVISLAIYANLNHSIGESRIHLQGLQNILTRHPGGLAALWSNSPEIGNKIRRVDLELALLAGTQTIFGCQHLMPLPKLSIGDFLCPGILGPAVDNIGSIVLPPPLSETNCRQVIYSAMRDVLLLCTYAGSAQLSTFQYGDRILSILQRLHDYSPLSHKRPSRQLDNISQLGLLAFMSTLLHHSRGSRSACSPLLSDLLRTCLAIDRPGAQMVIAYGRADQYHSLHLWLMFIYAVSGPDFEECCKTSSSVARLIRSLANILSLETWDDVAAQLNIYPWVAAFHDEPSKKLWAVI